MEENVIKKGDTASKIGNMILSLALNGDRLINWLVKHKSISIDTLSTSE